MPVEAAASGISGQILRGHSAYRMIPTLLGHLNICAQQAFSGWL